jgi:hypothetical protein
MTLWMKRNIIISTINWWAKTSTPIVFLFFVVSIIISCKKSGDFNLGSKKQESYTGIQFTDTFSIINETLLLNDSLVSATSPALNFGYYQDPAMGDIYSEAYCALTLMYPGTSYAGAQVDSSYLFINYSFAYGDTTSLSSVSIHEITTQMDLSVPYKTTSNFVTYNSSVDGVLQNTPQAPLTPFTSPQSSIPFTYQTFPNSNDSLKIPLTNTFASGILAKANNNANSDFNSIFYGIVIKNNNNWTSGGSVVRANYSSGAYKSTRLIVYYHIGNQLDSALFGLYGSTPSFNRVIPKFSGVLANLKKNGDTIPPILANGNCFIQSGTGVVTKVKIPYLTRLQTANDTSVVINKALLYVPIESTPPMCDLQKYYQTSPIGLVEINPNNTYKYRSTTGLAIIQATGATQYSAGQALTDTATSYNTHTYVLDITSYVQAILSSKANNTTYFINDGFVIVPAINSYQINRSVIHSSTAVSNPMKLELYYTKVK